MQAQVSIVVTQEDVDLAETPLSVEMFKGMNIEDIVILFDIARGGSLERIQEVIALGWGVNFLDKSGKTFFMHAASENSQEAVEYILNAGAEIDKRTVLGWTALMYAAQANSPSVVKILLENGADASIKNGDGDTAAQLASTTEIAEFISSQGFATVTIESEPSNIPVYIYEFDISGWTPLTVKVPLNKEFSVSADERDGYISLSSGGYKYENEGPHTIELVLEPLPQRRAENQDTQRGLTPPPISDSQNAASPGFYEDTESGSDIYAMLDYAGITDVIDCPPEMFAMFDGTRTDDFLCLNTEGDAAFQTNIMNYAQQSMAVNEFFEFEPIGSGKTQFASLTYNDGYEVFIAVSIGQAVMFGGN